MEHYKPSDQHNYHPVWKSPMTDGVRWKPQFLQLPGESRWPLYSFPGPVQESLVLKQLDVRKAGLDWKQTEKTKRLLVERLNDCRYFVRTKDYFLSTDKCTVNVVMENCNKGSLARLISAKVREGEHFSDTDVVNFAADIIRGLLELRARGFWHLDLRPAKVCLSLDKKQGLRSIKLLLPSRLVPVEQASDPAPVSDPRYRSPEYSLHPHRQKNEPADVFAVGCILYELLNLNSLYFDLLGNHSDSPDHSRFSRYLDSRSISAGDSELYPRSVELVEKAIHRDPLKRWSLEQCQQYLCSLSAVFKSVEPSPLQLALHRLIEGLDGFDEDNKSYLKDLFLVHADRYSSHLEQSLLSKDDSLDLLYPKKFHQTDSEFFFGGFDHSLKLRNGLGLVVSQDFSWLRVSSFKNGLPFGRGCRFSVPLQLSNPFGFSAGIKDWDVQLETHPEDRCDTTVGSTKQTSAFTTQDTGSGTATADDPRTQLSESQLLSALQPRPAESTVNSKLRYSTYLTSPDRLFQPQRSSRSKTAQPDLQSPSQPPDQSFLLAEALAAPQAELEFSEQDQPLVEAFRGSLGPDGAPCLGRLTLRDGRVYEGQLAGMLFEGTGKLYFEDRKSWFTGYFTKGAPVPGKPGELVRFEEDPQSPSTFVGEVDREFRKLTGTLSFKDGEYCGRFLNDQFEDSKASLKLLTGEVLVGLFSKGKIEYGSIVYCEGHKYHGPLSQNAPHGKGVFSTPHFSYEGSFDHGEFRGSCTIRFKPPTFDPELVELIEAHIDGLRITKHAVVQLCNGCKFYGEFDELTLDTLGAPLEESSLAMPSILKQPASSDINGRGKKVTPDGIVCKCEFRRGQGEGAAEIEKEKEYRLEADLRFGRKHGTVRVWYENGSHMQCLFDDDKPMKGTYVTTEGHIYNGPFNSQLQFETTAENPVGSLAYAGHPSIKTYEGQFCAGKMHGTGKTCKKNGDVFEGQFRENRQLGQGTLRECGPSSSGDVYRGHFEKFLLNGVGCKLEPRTLTVYRGTFEQGQFVDKFVGLFVGGVVSGKGRAEYPDGSVYSGDLVNRLRHGQGELRLKDGSVFQSYWEKDLLSKASAATGKYFYPPACKEFSHFLGPLKSLKAPPTGKGIVVFRDGTTAYKGDVVEGLPHGFGQLFLDHHDLVFEGEFKHGLKHGKGKTVYKDGKREKAIFENGFKK